MGSSRSSGRRAEYVRSLTIHEIRSVLAAFVARLILEPIPGVVAPLILFSLAVTLSAWYGGPLAGTFGDCDQRPPRRLFFIEPIHSFQLASRNLAQQTELLLFLVTGVAISVVSHERLSSQAKLRQSLIREREAREEAQVANRLKDEFMATVSHELRTPLNAILGWSTLVLKGRLDQTKSVQAMEPIERNAKIQVRLIEDLQDISRIVSGRLHLVYGLVRLEQVIEATADMVRPAAEAKKVQLCLALGCAADEVMGDSTRLQQIVWNLISNAVKFTDEELK